MFALQLISHKDAYDETSDDDKTEQRVVTTLSNSNNTAVRKPVAYTSVQGHSDDESADEHSVMVKSPISSAADTDAEALEEGGTVTIEFGHGTKTEVTEAPEEDEDEEEDVLGLKYGIIWLSIITVFVALLSEIISSTIEKAASSVGISAVFLSAIVLPIVGNAAEHAGAVMFAMKGKVDLSLGVAIGSSTQIALLVLPLLVLLGWMMDKDMSLNFGAYESGTLILTVVSVTFAIKDGKSNWLLGFCLIVAYIIIAIGFWAHKDDSLTTDR